jgi:hypothetical protein
MEGQDEGPRSSARGLCSPRVLHLYLQAIGSAISSLEAAGGISAPALSAEIEGEWELLYTSRSRFDPLNPLGARVDGSRPGLEAVLPALLRPLTSAAQAVSQASSSPIQRTVTAIQGLLITQDIRLNGPDPRVDQRVALGSGPGSPYLRLSAAASVSESAPARVRRGRGRKGGREGTDGQVLCRMRRRTGAVQDEATDRRCAG